MKLYKPNLISATAFYVILILCNDPQIVYFPAVLRSRNIEKFDE